MGKSKELATLTDAGGTIDGALTITETSNQALNLTTTGLGSQVVYQSSTTNTPWYTGVAGSTADDFLIYQGATANAGDIYMYTNSYERMRIDAAGRVTMPYQAGFAAYSPATGTGGQNAIVYGSTYHNIGNHYNTSTGIFTAPIAGRYLFTASCLFNYSSGGYHRLDFRLNGSVYNSYGETLENQAGPSYSSATISNIFTLNANDTMQMWNGSSVTTYGSSYGHFSGIMLA